MKKMFRLVVCFLLLSVSNVFAFETEWSSGIEPKIRIISPVTHNDNKNEIYLGLQYQLEKGWKTYWRSSGEGGFPQEIDYSSSTNVKNIKIYWPTPEQFSILDLDSLGYKNTVKYAKNLELKIFNRLKVFGNKANDLNNTVNFILNRNK